VGSSGSSQIACTAVVAAAEAVDEAVAGSTGLAYFVQVSAPNRQVLAFVVSSPAGGNNLVESTSGPGQAWRKPCRSYRSVCRGLEACPSCLVRSCSAHTCLEPWPSAGSCSASPASDVGALPFVVAVLASGADFAASFACQFQLAWQQNGDSVALLLPFPFHGSRYNRSDPAKAAAGGFCWSWSTYQATVFPSYERLALVLEQITL